MRKAYLLQFSNVGCRFGGYAVLKDAFGVQPGGGYLQLVAMGGASGALAGLALRLWEEQRTSGKDAPFASN